MTARPSPDSQLIHPGHARLLAGMTMLLAVGSMAIWLSDQRVGQDTLWDGYAIPVLAALYFGGGLLYLLKARYMAGVIWAALLPTSIYLQVVLHLALGTQSMEGLSSVSAICQTMLLFYIAAFVTLRRGAVTMSWLHYAGIAAQYLLLIWTPAPAAGWTEAHRVMHKTLLTSVLIQPACIVALHVIVHLRDRLHEARQEAFKGKERFLAMLSHEIRTPLQAMLGSIDLLALKLRGGTEGRAVDRLRTAATQLETHLRDVTEFTRLEDPALRIHTAPCDLPQLIQDLREEWAPQALAKGLSLAIDIPPQDRVALQAARLDAMRVRQILSNLLSNAIKYTLVGSVTVHASHSRQHRGHVSLVVTDTGIGLAPEHHGTIFQPYVRLEDPRVSRAEGSGLGLAVVQRLVDRLGGQLRLESHPDQGSRFEVTLPIADNA